MSNKLSGQELQDRILAITDEKESTESNNQASLFHFLKYSFRQYKYENWHHHLVCDYLQRWVKGEIKRLMIFAPPRHMKTESSQRALTWALGKNDDCKLIICGYSDAKARKISMNIRDNVKDDKFKLAFPKRVTDTYLQGMDTQSYWRLDTNTKSQALAAGVGGPITGEGFTLGYIDDPYKSRETAESPVIRDKTNEWYTDTFLTRQDESYSGILMTTTRWHKHDLNGFVLSKDGIKEYNGHKPSEGCPDWNGQDEGEWTVLNLVAIHDEESYQWKHEADPRSIGDALWPDRFNVDFLKQFQANKYNWAANYMGVPISKGGNLISREWFTPVEALPYDCNLVRFWDLAGTPKLATKQNDPDYTAGVLVAEQDGKFYIVDVQAIRDTPMAVDNLVLRTAKNDSARYGHKVTQYWEEEGGASGKHLTDKYKKLLSFCKRVPYRTGKSKEFYLDNLANKAETGDIFYLDKPDWVQYKTDHGTFWDELEQYPKGVHDDRIDAAAKAIHVLSTSQLDLSGFLTNQATMA
jgi:predicted phage terminase large subunit-like protein